MPSHVRTHRDSRDGGLIRASRPRWLLPGLAVGLVAASLVVGGFLSLSTVLYFGFFGGMILMHVGGHGGHGGHASHGGQDTREGHDGDATPDAHGLSPAHIALRLARQALMRRPQTRLHRLERKRETRS